MLSPLGMAAPGMGTPAFSQSNQFLWGGSRAEIIENDYVIDSSSLDAGSNLQTILRPGLGLGRITASGRLKHWDLAATDGSQNLIGFLKEEQPVIDGLGRAQLGSAPVVIKAPVKARQVLYLGQSIVGSPVEFALRNQIRRRFFLDDEPLDQPAPNAFALRTRVAIADINAGSGFTLLPALPGLRYRVQDVSLIAIGGAAAGATAVVVNATQATATVALLSAAVAGLTQNTLLRAGAANATILANGASFVPNDVNTPIVLFRTVANLTTATHIDVLLNYEITT